MFAELPHLGVGLGYRPALRAETFWHRNELDLLELTAEEFLGSAVAERADLTALTAQFPLLLHGIELSLGSDAPPDETYLSGFAELARRIRAPWVSEHLSFVRAGAVEVGHLTPLPPTWEAIAVVTRNIKALQARLDVPVLLENITTLIDLPGDMTEWQFLSEVLERTGAGLLLDVTNLYTNAVNRDRDPWRDLEEVPLERAVELHLAGGHEAADYLVDSHSAPILGPVWELTEHIVRHADVRGIIIERDTDFPPFAELVAEAAQARRIWTAAREASHAAR